MEKLQMKSQGATPGNVAKIAALFPNCVTERLDKDGNPEMVVDFDKLRQELSTELVEGEAERYQFTWPDKRAANHLANQPTTMTLRPCVEESVGKDGTAGGFDSENLYIEGDNLDVLKVLRETYLGKVKMIYIDPPYNTGHDFVYNDDFSSSRAEFENLNKQLDEDGNLLFIPTENSETNGRFHTNWLNMIYPRIKVARDLLTDDGVIFISIDDNEESNIRKVCDEIMGEQNFIATFVWEKRLNRENRKQVSVRHDYILCYAKDITSEPISLLPMNDKALSNYSNPDNDPRGLWKSDPAHAQGGHGTKSQFYTLIAPNGKHHELPSGRCWLYTEPVMNQAIQEGRIWFGKDGNGVPRIKTYLNSKDRGLTPETMLFAKDVSTNEKAKNDLKQLFDGVAAFETPKPMELLLLFARITTKSNDLILDFFSGSAATAHAVMELNAEDEGSRRFIMVQLPEVTDEKSEARKAGYKTICDIGKERIRRAGKQILASKKNEDNGLFAGTEDNHKLDIGFRVLKLDTSNMENVFYSPDQLQPANLFTLEDNVKQDRTSMDLLFQVMLELGIDLSSTIERKEINGVETFVVKDGFLIATFDKDVNESTITEIAKQEPVYFVMRDASAANDNVLDNFDQLFKHYSPDTIRRIL